MVFIPSRMSAARLEVGPESGVIATHNQDGRRAPERIEEIKEQTGALREIAADAARAGKVACQTGEVITEQVERFGEFGESIRATFVCPKSLGQCCLDGLNKAEGDAEVKFSAYLTVNSPSALEVLITNPAS